MRVLFQTLGCKRNFSESSSLMTALRQAGHVSAG
ncbi:MAG: hypothetical protein J5635_01755, partial [Paludibacteraceae bacterium]|nr:hypothetical protein [Paludibacteraceae bacterium]